ncbi:hypothetical protein M419DRAFT_138166 [Trichoderma reesei RUT C-30]|uniref:Uncharacterized protein n=1 Tax=Hypocrea jecorina (strain ATCC 56765 / BCRC 32924 / NRRL 11460 / Rut C-30) TaxID=1344414 RepID=A0A024S3F2_HYPJR|nr:hypothetical protein M419DRAFT_138166 [Trichoderma reesei RUT C-30]
MRGREKAVGESRQDGRAKAKEATKLSLERPSKRRQHSGICGRMPRLPVVRPSPVDKSWWAATCLLTTINHRPSPLHLGPIESWCNADPPTPRWHTPLLHSDPCRDQAYPALDAQLHPESQNLCVCVLGLAPKYQPASSARPTVELAPWREETCSCWQERRFVDCLVGDLTRKRTNVCSCLHAAVARLKSVSPALQAEPPPSIAAPALSLRPGVFHLPGTVGGPVAPPSSPDV